MKNKAVLIEVNEDSGTISIFRKVKDGNVYYREYRHNLHYVKLIKSLHLREEKHWWGFSFYPATSI